MKLTPSNVIIRHWSLSGTDDQMSYRQVGPHRTAQLCSDYAAPLGTELRLQFAPWLGPVMRMWKTSDPELLPIGRSRCPKCQTRMVTAAVEEGPEGFEHRSFECSNCGHSEQNVIASDPMNTNALGWLNSELHPPK